MLKIASLQAPETPSPILHKRPRNEASLRETAPPPVKHRHLDLIRKASPDEVHCGSSSDESVGETRPGENFPSSVEMQSLSSETNSQNSPMNSGSKVSYCVVLISIVHTLHYRIVVLRKQPSIRPQWILSSHKRSAICSSAHSPTNLKSKIPKMLLYTVKLKV